MRLTEVRENYYQLSGTGSTVARQLSFAGIALVWVFRVPTDGSVVLPVELQAPTAFLVLGLALDMLHYLIGAALWGGFHRFHERQKPDEPDRDVDVPAWLNWPAIAAFWGKASCVALAYILILKFAVGGISFGS